MRLAALLLLAALLAAPGPDPAGSRRRMAVTFDDLPVVTRSQAAARWETITRDLLGALARHEVPVIGFVNEGKLRRDGTIDPERVALLRRWIQAGLELGNHTRSHLDLHRVSLADFEEDLLLGETTTRELLSGAGKRLRYFRHPYLHTGRDAGTRGALASFLTEHGYRVAPVTIDNDDYVFASAYDRADLADDAAGRDKIVEAYLDYMRRVVAYYESQSRALFGREIPQILLLHASALNAATFDRLAGFFEERGYAFVSLDMALDDEAYASPDEYYGPAGITWIHRWALTQGRKGAFFDGEPEVPGWIEDATR